MSHVELTCTVSSASGTIMNGNGLSGTAIGTIMSSALGTSASKCSGPFSATALASQKSGVIENIDAASYNSSTGVTTGDISSIDVMMSIEFLLGTCTLEIIGSANSTYSNLSGILTFTGTGALRIKSATGSGCSGVWQAGDSLSYSTGTGGYRVTDDPGPLTITSP